MDLATENYQYAKNVARNFCRTKNIISYDMVEDVVGWSMLGLTKASKLWDGTGSFQGYAYFYILNAIKDGLRAYLGRRGQKINVLAEPKVSQTEALYELVDDRDLVERLFKELTQKEFDFTVGAEYTPKNEIAKRHNLHPARISQIRKTERVREVFSRHLGR